MKVRKINNKAQFLLEECFEGVAVIEKRSMFLSIENISSDKFHICNVFQNLVNFFLIMLLGLVGSASEWSNRNCQHLFFPIKKKPSTQNHEKRLLNSLISTTARIHR